jgi:hypothetical protein
MVPLWIKSVLTWVPGTGGGLGFGLPAGVVTRSGDDQSLRGNPRLTPPWDGSSQRDVTTFDLV